VICGLVGRVFKKRGPSVLYLSYTSSHCRLRLVKCPDFLASVPVIVYAALSWCFSCNVIMLFEFKPEQNRIKAPSLNSAAAVIAGLCCFIVLVGSLKGTERNTATDFNRWCRVEIGEKSSRSRSLRVLASVRNLVGLALAAMVPLSCFGKPENNKGAHSNITRLPP